MKYCSHCGKELLDDAIICPQCGCSVQYGNVGNTAETYTAMSIIGFVFAFISGLVGLIISVIANSDARKTGNQKSQTLSKAGIIVAIVRLALGVVVIGFWLIIFAIAIANVGAMSNF